MAYRKKESGATSLKHETKPHSQENQSRTNVQYLLYCLEKRSHLRQQSITEVGVGWFNGSNAIVLQDKLVPSHILIAGLFTTLIQAHLQTHPSQFKEHYIWSLY